MSVINPKDTSKGSKDARAQLQDDHVMGTNNSSIVSKRSVERLYYANEAHFFRYFVKKPQRRSPLINRGYWLRMKLINQTVQRFLEETPNKRKFVVNLGCGYDPLPWQCITRYPDGCKYVTFIDVDFQDLILKKRKVVQDNKELSSLLTNTKTIDQGHVLLRSDEYVQIGCDLRDLSGLADVFSQEIGSDESLILFVAEVSITYVDVGAADELIKWAGSFFNSRFCLLEQTLPCGRDYPFARTMLAHFQKLQTPLFAVEKYSTISAQRRRFASLGWQDIQARSLWSCWCDPNLIPVTERQSLDRIEPFDELEDFALFGCHYMLLVADSAKTGTKSEHALSTLLISTPSSKRASSPRCAASVQVNYRENLKVEGRRRFGAAMQLGRSEGSCELVANFAGMGMNTRTNSYDIYAPNQADPVPSICESLGSFPLGRMCFTITDLGGAGALLVGGRTSPDQVKTDCWLFHKLVDAWERVEDHPQPRYRHGAVNLGNGCVLVSTGRVDSKKLADDYYIWSRSLGWVKCVLTSRNIPPPTYGATLTVSGLEGGNPGSYNGLLAGGLSAEGVFQAEIWEWELREAASQEPILMFRRLKDHSSYDQSFASIARFGAVTVNHDDKCYIVGGIVQEGLLSPSDGICAFDHRNHELQAVSVVRNDFPELAPLLIGMSAVSQRGSLLIMGGGSVCFSFGSFWNEGSFTISILPKQRAPIEATSQGSSSNENDSWKFICTRNLSTSTSSSAPKQRPPPEEFARLVSVPRVKVGSHSEFEKILQASTPVILNTLDIGSCTETWTVAGLKDRIGAARQVVVHEATTEHMNFVAKNFKYMSKALGEFLDQAEAGRKVYLRSLSSEKGAETPANFWKDFPSISADFNIPPELSTVQKNIHSSVLRISGALIVWLHYDVMANILCQIRGSKRLLLFPPSDVKHFRFEPGASSSGINVFANPIDPGILSATPHEALLNPGDILYIPPLWLHSASPISKLSIAVNVFFRSLKFGYAAGRDVYGNRDLQAYENGRMAIAKIVESFRKMPSDVRVFYLQRLVEEFAQKVG